MNYLVILSTAGSFVLAAYVLVVTTLLIHHRGADIVGDAALYAAHTLAGVHVESTALGIVGVCDQGAEESNGGNLHSRNAINARGINTVYATLRLSALIAKNLKNPTISQLLSTDFATARQMESELSLKMRQAVAKSAVTEDEPVDFFGIGSRLFGNRFAGPTTPVGHFVYKDIYHYLSRSAKQSGAKLVELNVRLGYLRWDLAETAVMAPERSEMTIADDNGFYKAGVPIFVPNFPPIMFTTSPVRTRLVSPATFIDDERKSAPCVILVEAVFKEHKRGGRQPGLITKSACAVIGNQTLKHTPSALVFNFPQGIPKQIQSAQYLLDETHWQTNGSWRQAKNGDVPGPGTLSVPAAPRLADMPPNQAFALAFYGWLKSLPTNADPTKCLRLLSTDWQSLIQAEQPRADTKEGTAINSCLVQDTDGRTFAFLNQGAPGGAGQAALANAFAGNASSPGVIFSGAPPSSLPLVVDGSGACNLPGGKRFDANMLARFFEQVHDTNLAAIESIAVAKQMRTKFQEEHAQLEPKLLIEKQEWNSILNRISRQNKGKRQAQEESVGQQVTDLDDDKLLQAKLALLHKALVDDEKEIARLSRAIALSSIAIVNGTRTVELTYQITANAFSLCREGLIPLDMELNQFLIGRKLIFTPDNKPLSELDFDESANVVARRGIAPPCPPGNLGSTDWLKSGLAIGVDVEDVLNRQDRAASIIKAKLQSIFNERRPEPIISPTLIVIDSQMLTAKGLSLPTLCSSYPFSNVFIPSGQLVYYCQRALHTGNKPQVTWSVLIRDLAASLLEGNAGEPLLSAQADWCKQRGQSVGACPGLITEFQLRSPLPVLDEIKTGSIVRSQTGQGASQIPPLPPEVL